MVHTLCAGTNLMARDTVSVEFSHITYISQFKTIILISFIYGENHNILLHKKETNLLDITYDIFMHVQRLKVRMLKSGSF